MQQLGGGRVPQVGTAAKQKRGLALSVALRGTPVATVLHHRFGQD